MISDEGKQTNPDKKDHKLLALWAADCAEHVLPYFEKENPGDDRPRKAIEAARSWARDEIRCGDARATALAAHAAARDAAEGPVRFAARAAGHAAATAHVASHASAVAIYAVKTVSAAEAAREHEWQYKRLPKHLRAIAFPSRTSRRS